jgi:hypothetical protein
LKVLAHVKLQLQLQGDEGHFDNDWTTNLLQQISPSTVPTVNRLIQEVKDTLSIKTNPNAKTLHRLRKKGLTRAGADPLPCLGSKFACAEAPSSLRGRQRD